MISWFQRFSFDFNFMCRYVVELARGGFFDGKKVDRADGFFVAFGEEVGRLVTASTPKNTHVVVLLLYNSLKHTLPKRMATLKINTL
jgi:hypothetical protein